MRLSDLAEQIRYWQKLASKFKREKEELANKRQIEQKKQQRVIEELFDKIARLEDKLVGQIGPNFTQGTQTDEMSGIWEFKPQDFVTPVKKKPEKESTSLIDISKIHEIKRELQYLLTNKN